MKSLSSLAIGLIICSGIYLGAEEPVPSIQRGQVWKDLSTIQLKRGDSLLIDCAKMHDGSILFHILHFYDKTTEKPLALVRQPVILGADTVENVSIGPVMGYADGKVELSFLTYRIVPQKRAKALEIPKEAFVHVPAYFKWTFPYKIELESK